VSLINQMLKDLEAREQGERGLAELPAAVRVVEPDEPRFPLIGLLVLAVLGGLVLAAAWFWLRPAPGSSHSAPAVGTPELAPAAVLPQPSPTAVTAAPLAPHMPAQVAAERTTEVPAPMHQAGEPTGGQAPATVSGLDGEPATARASSETPPAAAPRPALPVASGKRVKEAAVTGGSDLPSAKTSTPPRRRHGTNVYGGDEEARDSAEAYPDSPTERLRRARRYAALGDEEQALSLLEGFPSSDVDAGKLRAQLLLKLGRTRQAEEELRTAAALDGGDPEVQGLLGALYQKQGRYDEAASRYGQALRSQPGQARWWLGLAVSLDGAERYQEALEAYGRTAALGGLSRDVQVYVVQRIDALRGGR
jgi:MSHA biogenesis protein MshN